MVASLSVDATCATCGAATTALPWIVSEHPHLVACARHRPSRPDTSSLAPPPSAEDLLRASMPADCRGAQLNKISDPRLRETLSGWAREASGGGAGRAVVILGGPGTGKTNAVWAAIAAAIRCGSLTLPDVVAGTEQSLMEPMGVQSRFTGRRDSWGQRLTGQRVVFVDDVGYAQFVDAETRVAVWKDLLDRVCARDLTLFLTSNIASPDVLADILQPAVASRLFRLARGSVYSAGTLDRRNAEMA